MRSERPRVTLERGAVPDVWRRTLCQIETIFGRLVYLAGLRDNNTGRYQHHGLALIFGDEDADQALRNSHETTFAEWLSFGLENQKADLDLYLSQFAARKRTTVETWLRLTPYRNLIPTRTGEPERSLYLSDFEALLELLKAEYGVAEPDSDA
jgi:hypothetical protein